jgi:spermidine/putrescine transport system substrate-binding protein
MPKLTHHLTLLLSLLLVLFAAACSKPDSLREKKKLGVYNWANYIGKSTIYNFERANKLEVIYDTYASNEELLETLDRGTIEADVIFPSDYMVQQLIDDGMLAKLDHKLIPNLVNIDARFKDKPYDPGHKYCIPYTFGTTGLAYNAKYFEGSVEGWGALWDRKFSGKISLLDDSRSAFVPAFRMLGTDINSTDADLLAKATLLMRQQKNLVKAYTSEDYPRLLAEGDVWIAQAYSGEAVKLMRDERSVRYVIPAEGAELWIDNVCIVRRSRRKADAHRFINYLLQPEIAADLTTDTGYATANVKATEKIKPDLLQNPAVFPPPDALARCQFFTHLGDEAENFDTAWEEVKRSAPLPFINLKASLEQLQAVAPSTNGNSASAQSEAGNEASTSKPTAGGSSSAASTSQ